MAADNYRYRVFISYNHRDKAWAEWLEQKLEGYRVPRGLEAKSQIFESVPKRLKPVFRDRSTAAAGGSLPDRVKDWLDDSESLIVICSPNSAHPNPDTGQHWVDEEITHFRKTGKAHRIFALIVGGEPGSGGEDEAFPPAFREIHPAAADAREEGDGKTLAFMKLAAGLLGVELIDLQDKQNREDQKRARTARRVAAGFAGLALIAGLGLWIAAANYWEAQKNRANLLAAFAQQEADSGYSQSAMLLALAGTNAGNGILAPQSEAARSQLRRALSPLRRVSDILRGHTNDVLHVGFSSDGTRLVTASVDGTARIWNARTGASLHVLDGHSDNVVHATFSPDGSRLATASYDFTTRIWDVATGQVLHNLEGHENVVVHAAYSPDANRLVTASYDGTARVWDTVNGSLIYTLDDHNGYLDHAAFSPDGTRLVTASWDGSARVRKAISGEVLRTLASHGNSVVHAAFSQNGARLVTSSHDGNARIWNVASGELLSTLEGHTNHVTHGSFSSNGARVVTASSDNTAIIWDAATGEAQQILDGHRDSVDHAAFSPDSALVVTVSIDGWTMLWDAVTGAYLDSISSVGRHASFSPSGERLVVAQDNGTTVIYDVSHLYLVGDALVQAACELSKSRVPIRLTPDEARRFFGDPNHPDAAPCERVGPLSPRYYTRALGRLLGGGETDGGARSALDSAASGGAG